MNNNLSLSTHCKTLMVVDVTHIQNIFFYLNLSIENLREATYCSNHIDNLLFFTKWCNHFISLEFSRSFSDPYSESRLSCQWVSVLIQERKLMSSLCCFIHTNHCSFANHSSTSDSFTLQIDNKNAYPMGHINFYDLSTYLERISHRIYESLLVSRQERREIDRVVNKKLISTQEMFL